MDPEVDFGEGQVGESEELAGVLKALRHGQAA